MRTSREECLKIKDIGVGKCQSTISMRRQKNCKKTKKRWLTKENHRDIIIELTAKNDFKSCWAAKNISKKLLTKNFYSDKI